MGQFEKWNEDGNQHKISVMNEVGIASKNKVLRVFKKSCWCITGSCTGGEKEGVTCTASAIVF